MEIKTTIAKLQNIAFAQPPQPSLIEQLYTKKPERGGAKAAYRIAALRGAIVRLLGPDSAFEATRQQLIDEHHEPAVEGEAQRKFKSDDDMQAFIAAIDELRNEPVTFDGELLTLDQLDAAGYTLSGIEIDALMGLLIQPEA